MIMINPIDTAQIRKPQTKSGGAQNTKNNPVKKNDGSQKTGNVEQIYAEINGKEFSSLAEAIKEIIKLYDPTVIGFGEFHNNKKNGVKTTGEYFSEVIPLLAAEGFNNSVLEFARTDQDFKDELAYLRTVAKNDTSATAEAKKKAISDAISSKNTPIISRTIGRAFDKEGVRAVMISVVLQDDMGVSGPFDNETWDRYFWGDIPDTAMWKMTNDGELKSIRGSLANNAKVFSYTGGDHNDIFPKHPEYSFGDDMSKEIKGKYLEVDLVVPEYASVYNQKWSQDLAEQAPASGVKVIVQDAPQKSNSTGGAKMAHHIYILFGKTTQ